MRTILILSLFFRVEVWARDSKSFESNESKGSSKTMTEKLQHQFTLFEMAQLMLIQKHSDSTLAEKDKLISRELWDNVVTPVAPMRLNAADLRELVDLQERDIARSRADAIKASVINFSDFKRPSNVDLTQKFCASVPKGGMLHIHPSGTVMKSTARELLNQYNPVIPAKEYAAELDPQNNGPFLYDHELAWLNKFPSNPSFLSLSESDQNQFVDFFALPPGSHPFRRFDAVFYFVDVALSDKLETRLKMYDDFAARAAKHKVSYVEFTTGVRAASIPVYDKLGQELESKYNLIVRFNRATGRMLTFDQQVQEAQVALTLPPSKWVTGIDLLGDETYTPAFEQGQYYYGSVLAARHAGKTTLRSTQHAGELGDSRNPRDAILMGAERLGHAVKLIEDPVVLEYARLKKIAIETSLLSNLKLQAIDDIKKHPYLRYLRLGLPVSLHTDDEGIFDTNISMECEIAIRETDITYYEFKKMAFNSIEASFADDLTKQKLKLRLTAEFASFEKNWLSQQNLAM